MARTMAVPPRRKELRRKKRLASGGSLSRTPMKRRNAKRAAKRRARDFGSRAGLIAAMPCCNCGTGPKSDPHHEPPRSLGGTKADLCPLCRTCHVARHAAGSLSAFMANGGVDLRAEVLRYREVV